MLVQLFMYIYTHPHVSIFTGGKKDVNAKSLNPLTGQSSRGASYTLASLSSLGLQINDFFLKIGYLAEYMHFDCYFLSLHRQGSIALAQISSQHT